MCGPEGFDFDSRQDDLAVVIYGSTNDPSKGYIGGAIKAAVRKQRLAPATLAWDLVTIALSVFASDLAGHRDKSPDGWTRIFELVIAVSDPVAWSANREIVEKLLCFLTTDVWSVSFVEGGEVPEPHAKSAPLEVDATVLLSGGLDSLVGTIDLSSTGKKLLAVSQVVRGDGQKQEQFGQAISGVMSHLVLSHTQHIPSAETPASQRSRSLLFLAYGVLAATATRVYSEGKEIDLFVCENGFIALNPPLTPARVGSLSTRTTHPVVFALFRQLLNNLGLHLRVVNPYEFKTKGEMLRECQDQFLLKTLASQSTSCGRFKQYGYKHCGRCVPCMVRRAAFVNWNVQDDTFYKFDDLGRDDSDYAGFDDVRSTMIAIAESKQLGVIRWLGATLSSGVISGKDQLRHTACRGLGELEVLMKKLKVT
jgi:hypothetical protein